MKEINIIKRRLENEKELKSEKKISNHDREDTTNTQFTQCDIKPRSPDMKYVPLISE